MKGRGSIQVSWEKSWNEEVKPSRWEKSWDGNVDQSPNGQWDVLVPLFKKIWCFQNLET